MPSFLTSGGTLEFGLFRGGVACASGEDSGLPHLIWPSEITHKNQGIVLVKTKKKTLANEPLQHPSDYQENR